ncbi:MAG: flagellar M-ring protein FliF [Spirochaetes bacterium]|nr:flagellar M-ring protein FliF [Spirochaetota bacterium]
MSDLFKQQAAKFAGLWAGWSIVQKAMLVGIAVVVLGGAFALFTVSAMPTLVNVIDAPIRDEAALDRIMVRLNQEGVTAHVTPAGVVQVSDEATAMRMRAILIREDLIPSGIDPWAIFDRDRWTITDFERNVNFQRAQTQMITNHIMALDDVDNANVQIVWPERQLFRADQNPVTASVIITPRPGSDITENRRSIEGIQRLLQHAIEGITEENITITDHRGLLLNDFIGMEGFDRQDLVERQMRFVQREEARLRALVLGALQSTFSADRVRDLSISIDMDMSRRVVDTTEFFPITISPRTPGLPFDDSVLLEFIPRSEAISETSWQGWGFHPQGPPGVEGQTPPGFVDMTQGQGMMTQQTRQVNHELNQRQIQEERSPQIDRITVSVNIDGTWVRVFDEDGNPVILPDGSSEREFVPIPAAHLAQAELLIRDAIGFSAARGDSVTVSNIPFDRTYEFMIEDAELARAAQIRMMLIIFLSGLVLLSVGFVAFRIISRESERRRKLAEEERERRERMLRESAMAEAEQEGMEVQMSAEERQRMDFMGSITNLAKDHPQDAAALIRTWILEE